MNLEWQAAAVALGGLAGQFLKSIPGIPNGRVQAAMLLCGLICFVAFNVPAQGLAWDGWLRYGLKALLEAASVNGVASLVGQHPALKTANN